MLIDHVIVPRRLNDSPAACPWRTGPMTLGETLPGERVVVIGLATAALPDRQDPGRDNPTTLPPPPMQPSRDRPTTMTGPWNQLIIEIRARPSTVAKTVRPAMGTTKRKTVVYRSVTSRPRSPRSIRLVHWERHSDDDQPWRGKSQPSGQSSWRTIQPPLMPTVRASTHHSRPSRQSSGAPTVGVTVWRPLGRRCRGRAMIGSADMR